MTRRAAWRGCFVTGVVAFACSLGFARMPGMHACGDAGGPGPILAFEIARTPAEIARLFGAVSGVAAAVAMAAAPELMMTLFALA